MQVLMQAELGIASKMEGGSLGISKKKYGGTLGIMKLWGVV
jgi:hypothetical protein